MYFSCEVNIISTFTSFGFKTEIYLCFTKLPLLPVPIFGYKLQISAKNTNDLAFSEFMLPGDQLYIRT